MSDKLTYISMQSFLKDYMRLATDNNPLHVASWVDEFDDSQITEDERLDVMLAAIKWEVEHDCIYEPDMDELYLYYEQLVNDELDDVIDPAEREEVVHDLTAFFNKVFPDGLED